MNKLNIIFKYIALYVGLFSATLLLSGCLGGTVAQQIARSIATGIADKTVARALDVDEDQAYSNRSSDYSSIYSSAKAPTQQAANSANLPKPYSPVPSQAQSEKQIAKQNAAQYELARRNIEAAQNDPYRIAISNTAFEEISLKPIVEPLPTDNAEFEKQIAVVQTNQLVPVELFNLLTGEEKNAVYEQARLMGAASLPQKREWPLWRVATGAIQSSQNHTNKKTITFLIPPEFGKLPSGAVTMVELASPGELNVARYRAN